MNTSLLRVLGRLSGACRAVLFCAVFNGSVTAAEQSAELAKASDLTVAEHIKQHGGGYSDMFVKLKQHAGFARLAQRYSLEDPATWPELRRRLVLNHAQLQVRLDDAESMAAVADRRSGLSQTVISAQQTRDRGEELKKQLSTQMDDIRQAVRLIDEMEAVLKQVGRKHALTRGISLENQAGQSFDGQVLLVDGNDLIVRGRQGGYFRVPANSLSRDTRTKVLKQVLAAWEELPELEQEQEKADRVLIAYDSSHLYLKQSDGGVVCIRRSASDFDFVPHAEQLEALEPADRRRSHRRDAEATPLQRLEAAQALNQSRLDTIEWYESRLGVQYPVTTR